MTYSPSADSSIYQEAYFADINYGTETTISVSSCTGSDNKHALLKFDISTYPNSGNIINGITSATLSIYKSNEYNTTTGRTYTLYRCKQNWIENEVTWNKYNSSTNWASAGGTYSATDYDSSLSASATVPAAGQWMTFTITDIVKDAITSRSNIVNLIIRDASENNATNVIANFTSKEYSESSYRPILTINYNTSASYNLSNEAPFYVFSGDDTTYNSDTYIHISAGGAFCLSTWRTATSFNVSSWGSSGNIATATIYLYYYAYSGDPHGVQVNIEALKSGTTWRNYTDGQVSWNHYNSASLWTSPGGDISSGLTMGTFNMPSSNTTYGWYSCAITDIVKNAIDNNSGIVNVLVRFNTDTSYTGTQYEGRFYGTGSSTYKAKIEIIASPGGWLQRNYLWNLPYGSQVYGG